MSTPTDPSERLREILAECLDCIAADGPGAEAAVLSRHPQEASIVRERLAKLRGAGLIDNAGATTAHLPERLGEFRLIRRLGAGGMGVVYLAEQESLQRRVALKLVRPEQLLFPGARERFRREVEIIAKLSDPGIVPIFAVGEDSGVPYFAMAVVDGMSMAELLTAVRELPPAELSGKTIAECIAVRIERAVKEPLPDAFRGSWSRSSAQLVQQMADAAQHAHERGVVHRDLKPSNAMVTADGRVVLLDFGLAATQGALRITRSGATIGTLHYMAPEQLRGDEVDARTDVYALGVTLHELLARVTPFDGESADSVRSAILAGAIPSIRRAYRDVPRDLETICLKAMDVDPKRRFASAAELSRDLGRFLEHRPIEARPAGPLLIARRFWVRHTALASVLASLPLLGAAAFVVADRIRVELDAQVGAVREDLTRSESKAEANLQSAMTAIAHLVAQTSDPALERSPGLDRMRAKQLDDAVALLRGLSTEHADRADLRSALAIGLDRAGSLWLDLGESERAKLAIDESESELRALFQLRPDDRKLRLHLCHVLQSSGLLQRAVGRLDDAVRIWSEGIDLLTIPAAEVDVHPDVLEILAALLVDRGLVLQATKDVDRAANDYRAALGYIDRRLALADSIAARLSRVRALANYSNLLLANGKFADARSNFEELVTETKALSEAEPKDPNRQRAHARALAGLAKAARAMGDSERAAQTIERATATFASLAEQYPERIEYRWDHDMAYFAAALDAEAGGDDVTAATRFARAIELHEAFLTSAPTRSETRRELASMWGRLALIHERNGRFTDGEQASEHAIASVTTLMTMSGTEPADAVQLAFLHYNRAIERRKREDTKGTREDLTAALPAFAAALRATAPFAPDSTTMMQSCRMLAEAQASVRDFDGVMRSLTLMQELAPLPHEVLVEFGTDLGVAEREDFIALIKREP